MSPDLSHLSVASTFLSDWPCACPRSAPHCRTGVIPAKLGLGPAASASDHDQAEALVSSRGKHGQWKTRRRGRGADLFIPSLLFPTDHGRCRFSLQPCRRSPVCKASCCLCDVRQRRPRSGDHLRSLVFPRRLLFPFAPAAGLRLPAPCWVLTAAPCLNMNLRCAWPRGEHFLWTILYNAQR